MLRSLIFAGGLALAATSVSAAVDIQEITTPGGVEAWLVEEDTVPFVALELRFAGGAGLDLPGKRGATALMSGLLEEGAGPYDSQGFSEARDALAASFDYDIYNDSLAISARFLTENRDEAVELLHLMLTEPRFAEEDIARVQSQLVSVIRSDATDPNDIASATFSELAYGDHPYATPLFGTVDSVEALTRNDVVTAYENLLRSDNVSVGASGDISADELSALLDDLLEGLPTTGPDAPEQVDLTLTPGVTVVDFATPQSVVYFGHEGIARDDPDFFPAFVANEIFGGSGRLSRLGEEVREKRGLTYGVGTYLANYDDADMLLGQFASQNDRVGEAVEIIREEWGKIADSGVTEDELADIKTYLTGAYPLRFDGNGRIAGILVGMQSFDLTPEYIETRNDRINAVTLDDVKRVAKRLFDPEALRFVIVGQPENVEPVN